MNNRVIQCAIEEYKAIDAANAHGLMSILRSPLHYKHNKENQPVATPAQALGTLTHMAILEPDEFRRNVVIQPDFNNRTKAGKAAFKEWAELIPDAFIATDEQAELAMAMRDTVFAQPYASALLADGQAERTLLWTDEETGVKCKARADWLCNSHAAVIDVKTAADASAESFRRACANYGYALQAAWYREACHNCGLGDRAFIFIVVETSPPHGVALYQLDEEAMHKGWMQATEALATYAECQVTGKYNGYPPQVQSLTLPPWAF